MNLKKKIFIFILFYNLFIGKDSFIKNFFKTNDLNQSFLKNIKFTDINYSNKKNENEIKDNNNNEIINENEIKDNNNNEIINEKNPNPYYLLLSNHKNYHIFNDNEKYLIDQLFTEYPFNSIKNIKKILLKDNKNKLFTKNVIYKPFKELIIPLIWLSLFLISINLFLIIPPKIYFSKFFIKIPDTIYSINLKKFHLNQYVYCIFNVIVVITLCKIVKSLHINKIAIFVNKFSFNKYFSLIILNYLYILRNYKNIIYFLSDDIKKPLNDINIIFFSLFYWVDFMNYSLLWVLKNILFFSSQIYFIYYYFKNIRIVYYKVYYIPIKKNTKIILTPIGIKIENPLPKEINIEDLSIN